MPKPFRNTVLSRRITHMRRDNMWYTSKRFYDSTKDFLVCPSLRDVERMEKRREALLGQDRDDSENEPLD